MNRVSKPLAWFKTFGKNVELKLCLSNFSRGIERQKEGYQSTNITLIFTRPADLFLIPYFWLIFDNFQNDADYLSINSLIYRDWKWLFFMSWSNFRLLLSNPSQTFKIDAMVTFLWLIKHVYFFDSLGTEFFVGNLEVLCDCWIVCTLLFGMVGPISYKIHIHTAWCRLRVGVFQLPTIIPVSLKLNSVNFA